MRSMSNVLDGWIYFDLEGPNGPVVTNRNFRYDADYFGSADPVLRLSQGGYRLTMRASGQGAPDGQIAFALLDLADTTPLVVDGSTTATLARNDTLLFGMDLEAGGQYLARLALTGNAYTLTPASSTLLASRSLPATTTPSRPSLRHMTVIIRWWSSGRPTTLTATSMLPRA